MADYFVELLVELLGTAFYALGAGTLAILGTVAEQAGVHTLSAGVTPLGLWFVGIGAIALYGGYLLTTDKLLPHIKVMYSQ